MEKVVEMVQKKFFRKLMDSSDGKTVPLWEVGNQNQCSKAGANIEFFKSCIVEQKTWLAFSHQNKSTY